MSDPNREISSTSITTSQVYTHPLQIPPDSRWKKLLDLIAQWKVERDAKCVDCARGLDLGRHGCHYETFEESDEESYAVGNCKAWPLSRRIQQLEEALQP